jgi:hypothetical protein
VETVRVLAGGWSARGLDLARLPGKVIGVNEAAIEAPNISIALSMDRLFVEARWPLLKERAGSTWIRRGNNRNREGEWTGLVVFDCDHTSTTFSEDADGYRLNGTHSGFCALNLAYRLRPARVVLFGFDHNRGAGGRAYWHADHAWRPGGGTTGGKYAAWARQYGGAAAAFKAAGIEVLNASLTSAIDAFPKVDPRKVLA